MKTGDRFLGMHNTRFAEAQVICLEYGGAESETIQLIMFGQTICIYFFVMHNVERGILRGFVSSDSSRSRGWVTKTTAFWPISFPWRGWSYNGNGKVIRLSRITHVLWDTGFLSIITTGRLELFKRLSNAQFFLDNICNLFVLVLYRFMLWKLQLVLYACDTGPA